LQRRGFDVGEADGKLGASTRKAVKLMQQKFGLPADSYPTPELLAALRGRS
jgi:peptidoglycan hydrolase-like protein with peptidoglycan-binding domain